MICYAFPQSAGNAVRLGLRPPAAARQARLLRKASNTWLPDSDPLAPDDPDAFVVADVPVDASEFAILDMRDLENGATYFYKAFYLSGGAWSSSAVVSAVPLCTFEVVGPDVLALLRERMADGLAALVARGMLAPKEGFIPVLTSPPVADETPYPVVTLHLDLDASGERVIGEDLGSEFDEVADEWGELVGWLARVRVEFVVWSLNGDERAKMRQAVRAVLQANLGILESAGCTQIDLELRHADDMETYSAPVFEVVGSLSCVALAAAGLKVSPIRDVAVQVVQA